MSYLNNAKKLRLVIETAMDNVDDNTALEAPQLSKIWKEGEYVKKHGGETLFKYDDTDTQSGNTTSSATSG